MSDHETQYSITENESYEGHIPDWTVMIYLAGDNNLSANSIAILQDLEAIAHDDNIRVLAGFDPSTPLPKGARYLEIHRHYHHGNPSGMKWPLHSDMVSPGHLVVSPDFCNPNPAAGVITIDEPTSKEGLSRFLKWAMKYRSKKRMLILFGHGTLIAGNTFLGDTNPPSFLRLKDFARIIRRHFGPGKQNLEILACDNCVMNGIEGSYELRNDINYMIGSQDLMLAMGWPFRKIIEVIQQNSREEPRELCKLILKTCARNLIDFSLMERSSEQAVIDLTKFRDEVFTRVLRELTQALKAGLETDRCGRVIYPRIVESVRLARLEAQSYWDETFVDLYDFCYLLLKKCNEFGPNEFAFLKDFYEHYQTQLGDAAPKDCAPDVIIKVRNVVLGETDLGKAYDRIAIACRRVLDLFRPDRQWELGIAPYSYYICPELQYSHGLSIYFPWVLPEAPIIFDPVVDPDHTFEVRDYQPKTAFDEYKNYSFAGCEGADWASFLIKFFKATLRNVRLVDYDFTLHWDEDPQFTKIEDFSFFKEVVDDSERAAPVVDLQKTSSDTGEQDGRASVRIKNYPRRFYLSPEDCLHREDRRLPPDPSCPGQKVYGRKRRVSYLGWNIRGLVAEVIDYHPPGTDDDEDRKRQPDTD